LSARAVAALEALPARLDTPLQFPAAQRGHINLDTWRTREWYPALEAAGLDKPPSLRLVRRQGCKVGVHVGAASLQGAREAKREGYEALSRLVWRQAEEEEARYYGERG
jgi:hypothetical protein